MAANSNGQAIIFYPCSFYLSFFLHSSSFLWPPCVADAALYFCPVVMVALWNRADHYIFALWFLLSFFPRLTMANFGPLTAEIGSGVWGTPANFNRFGVLPSLLQQRRSPEASQTLHDVWPTPGWYTVYTFSGALAKFTLCPSLAFSYNGSVTARHSSSGRQPNIAASHKEIAASYKKWSLGTFAESATYIRLGGHHVEDWPTF